MDAGDALRLVAPPLLAGPHVAAEPRLVGTAEPRILVAPPPVAAAPLPVTTGPRIAVAAVVKDEAAYLLEWLAWHRIVGVERFFLADNGSTDGTAEMLEALEAAGLVAHLPFPGRPGTPPQLPAYAALIARHRAEADWIAFIDADEFLAPAPGRGLGDVVAAFENDPAVGALAVNWAVFGSAGRVSAGEGLVVERFAARAPRAFVPNHHFKSIVRSAALLGPGRNPHVFALRPGFRILHADGAPLARGPRRLPGMSGALCWAPLRINHYVVKSREEFFAHKVPRGRATTARRRDAAFFAAHDRNDVPEPVAPALVAATRREQVRLARLVVAALVAAT